MNKLRQLELFDYSNVSNNSSQSSFVPKYWRLWVLLIAFVSSGLGYFLFPVQITAKSERSSFREVASEILMPVQVFEVAPVEGYTVQREYTGQVKAARKSALGFERAGKVIELKVQEGEAVSAGQALASLDVQSLQVQERLLLAQKKQAVAVLQELKNGPRSETIAAAQAEVADLEDQVLLKQAQRQRREKLYEEGAIARESLDNIAFDEAALRDRITAANSQLQELKSGARPEKMVAQQAVVEQINAQIEDLNLTIEKSTLRAPYSGTIADRLVNEGTVLDVGQPVATIVEGASPEVEIGVPEELALNLAVGATRTVNIVGKVYQAVVSGIKPEIDPATRTRLVTLQLEAASLEVAVPQQIARLQMEQTVAVEGFWLPITALQKGDRGLWSCYAVVSAESEKYGIVERRDVEVLHTQGELTFVRGNITAGDRIVESGLQRIVPHQRVSPQLNPVSIQSSLLRLDPFHLAVVPHS